MSWASTRRTLILAIIFSVIGAALAVFLVATFSRAPSCTDRTQNQDEEGVDCGGSCTYLCTASVVPPVTAFVRPLQTTGRVDAIAYIDNPNPSAAAKRVSYEVELFAVDRTVIAKKSGIVDLSPGASVPVFISGLYSGEQIPKEAFLTIDAPAIRWYTLARDAVVIPSVEDVRIEGTDYEPRVAATIKNPSVDSIADLRVVATVFDETNTAIASSQTVITEIPAHGSSPVIFTWITPFPGNPARIDVRPIVPLP